jgi:hypothetical protein
MAALATVDDLNAVTELNEPPARSERLLSMASAVVERWCKRTFHRVVDDAVTVLVGTDGIMELPAPAESVSSITSGGETVAPVGYVADHYRVNRTFGRWAAGAYTVTYTHGYDPIPEDVVLAVCQIVARHLTNPEGYQSVSIGEASTVYAIPATGYVLGLTLSPIDKQLLAPYRRPPRPVEMVR